MADNLKMADVRKDVEELIVSRGIHAVSAEDLRKLLDEMSVKVAMLL